MVAYAMNDANVLRLRLNKDDGRTETAQLGDILWPRQSCHAIKSHSVFSAVLDL